jgi:hemerythrin-like domain-containing protein
MKNIIVNLHRQHRELTKVTMQLVPLLDLARLQRGASDVRRLLRTLSGILHVHVSMEDRSFYPFLLRHRDEELRRVAEQYLAERDEIQGQFDDYSKRWLAVSAIESSAALFVDETRTMLLLLGTRMMQANFIRESSGNGNFSAHNHR